MSQSHNFYDYDGMFLKEQHINPMEWSSLYQKSIEYPTKTYHIPKEILSIASHCEQKLHKGTKEQDSFSLSLRSHCVQCISASYQALEVCGYLWWAQDGGPLDDTSPGWRGFYVNILLLNY